MPLLFSLLLRPKANPHFLHPTPEDPPTAHFAILNG